MKITIKNQEDVGKVVFGKNEVSKVVFGKISKVEDLRISNMSDVDTSMQQDGYVLVYDQQTNNYTFRAIQLVDGGYF